MPEPEILRIGKKRLLVGGGYLRVDPWLKPLLTLEAGRRRDGPFVELADSAGGHPAKRDGRLPNRTVKHSDGQHGPRSGRAVDGAARAATVVS
jgi:hypothetical protein